MITKMKKAQVVVREADRQRLLESLHEMGVLHIAPINPAEAVADEKVTHALDSSRRAVQVLSAIQSGGSIPDMSAEEAVHEVLAIERRQAEWDSRLSSLHRQLDQQAVWGNVTLADFQVLRSAGALPTFYLSAREQVTEFSGEFVGVVGDSGDGRVIVAVISRRSGKAHIPEDAEPLPTLVTDNPTLRAEAAEIEDRRKQSNGRLTELAGLLPSIREREAQLAQSAEFSIATNGALKDEALFGIQGWVPVDRAETLSGDLGAAGLAAGVRTLDPEEDETPPTLIGYPRWATPIKGLFDMLNTLPGYREMDLSAFFMIALPIFAAMLIGDGGYGLIFVLAGLLMYKKLTGVLGKEGTQLLIIMGGMTLLWGILTANFFGIGPDTMARAGGFIAPDDSIDWTSFYSGTGGWASIGNFMIDAAPLWRQEGEDTRELLIQISFLLGCAHLVAAHIRRVLALMPDQRALADIGWSVVLVAMLGVIWGMFFVEDGETAPVSGTVIMGGLAGGLGLVILFGAPSRNPIRRVLVGFASSLLPLIGTFGDTMSYIRLMAVGMASYYIAFAFNDLGSTVADVGTWAAAVPILLLGHALNIILCVIAIFAHGVRLNMLEFSGNAGVQWAGYAYAPFAETKT